MSFDTDAGCQGVMVEMDVIMAVIYLLCDYSVFQQETVLYSFGILWQNVPVHGIYLGKL